MKNLIKGILGKTPISIKWSLFRNMTLLVLLISGSILLTTYISSTKSLQELAKRLVLYSIEHTETELKRFFQPIYGIIKLSRQWGQAGLISPTNVETFNAQFIPILERFNQISSINTGDAEGNGFLLLRDGKMWLNREARPAEWGNRVRWTQLKDTNTVVKTWWEETGYDPRERPWYQTALKLKETQKKQQRSAEFLAWTQPYRFLTTKDLGITASTCVDKPDGSFYVLAFDIMLAAITNFTTNLDLTDNGKVFVISDDGLMLGLPKDKRFKTPESRKKAIGTHIASIQIPIIQDILNEAEKYPFSNPDYIRMRSSTKEIWWGGARTYFLGKAQRLWIVVAIPENDFFADINHRRNIISFIAFIALVFSFFMANLLARRYSKPINALVEESEKIRNLDMQQRSPIQTQIKEVNQLADAQNRMRTALKSFSSYIPVEVVKELVSRGEAAKIGGKTKTLTVMFTDIEGFTSLAESMKPKELTEHMALYFQEMLAILKEESATVDKFIGDSIVAFWGAPTPNPNHAKAACRTALKMRDRLHQLNEQWAKEGKPVLHTRFGLATGPVLVGNVGSAERLNYTVLGDTVNLASRLEGTNKTYNTEILACKPVKEATGKEFTWKFIDSVKVKGKSKSVELFELVKINSKKKVIPPSQNK